jgi:hypothetical protein
MSTPSPGTAGCTSFLDPLVGVPKILYHHHMVRGYTLFVAYEAICSSPIADFHKNTISIRKRKVGIRSASLLGMMPIYICKPMSSPKVVVKLQVTIQRGAGIAIPLRSAGHWVHKNFPFLYATADRKSVKLIMKQVSDNLELDISEEPLEQPGVSELDEECLLNITGGEYGTLAKQALVIGTGVTAGGMATMTAINHATNWWKGTGNGPYPSQPQGASSPTQHITYNITATNQSSVTIH